MRFDLAPARVHQPKLLILDEPLGNLDPVSQQTFLFDLLSLTLAKISLAHQARGTRNIGSFLTISCALSSMSFMRPILPKVVQRPFAFDQ